MSMFEDSRFRWRETYFVLFRSSDRPPLGKVQQVLSTLNEQYELSNLRADEQRRIDSLTLVSPEDFAALDICYAEGPDILEQGAELADQMRSGADKRRNEAVTKQIRQCDARFDVLHFEQVSDLSEEGEDEDDILDPSALLLVLDALAELTGGIAVDPQSGAVLSDEE